jgi:DNA replication protein DnaC
VETYFKDVDNRLRIRKYDIQEIDGESVYVETPEWKEYKNSQKTLYYLSGSNLPPHVAKLSLDDYIGKDRDKIDKLKLYVEKFEEKFHSVHLYFWSKENGTQKTTTASIVGKLLLEKGKSVQFVLMGYLLKVLSEEKFNPEVTETINKYRNCDFLIIDDSFDKKKATIYRSGFQIPFLDEFLRTRLEVQRRATCFSSNFSIPDIDEEVFGSSMRSLIKRAIPDPFLFSSSYELRNDFNVDDLWS